MNTPMNDRPEWLLKMADIEANCDLAVGGLAHELGMLASPDAAPPDGCRDLPRAKERGL